MTIKSEDKVKSLDILINNALNTSMGFRFIIEEETDALQKHDYRRAVFLQEEKESYAERYANIVEELNSHSEVLKMLPQNIKDRFQEEKKLFSTAVDANKAALRLASHITARLSSRIIQIARQTLEKEGLNYTKYGTPRQSHVKPLHMQVNQML